MKNKKRNKQILHIINLRYKAVNPHRLQKAFIRAEVIAFQDYVDNKGEQGAKDAGKARLEGKDYIMQDGDVCHFRINK